MVSSTQGEYNALGPIKSVPNNRSKKRQGQPKQSSRGQSMERLAIAASNNIGSPAAAGDIISPSLISNKSFERIQGPHLEHMHNRVFSD